MQNHEYVLVLAGGGGTRLWPKSREKKPKQFLKLGLEHSLLRVTIERARQLVDWSHIFIITNETQFKDVAAEVPELDHSQIICEPEKRETAMAMAVGAGVIYAHDPEAVIMNFASDHVITDDKEFIRVMKKASKIATSGEYLVTIGISPQYPHTGMGYIKIGQEIEKGSLPLFKVDAFKEKPNFPTAQAYIATGHYFWNANMYTWRASSLLSALEMYVPDIHTQVEELIPTVGKKSFTESLAKAYSKVEKISIDYAVSEKAKNLVLIPGDFGWNDVGDWSVVHELGKKDDTGTVLLREEHGEFVQYESANNLVHLDGRLVALIGIEDMIVIDTDEILLVVPRSRTQDVKKIVEQLKEKKKQKYL